MAELANHDFDAPERNSTDVQRPLHIVNIALNLVRSERLAWQQRKAQSFTVSPLHCGSWQDLGYRRSHEYGYNPSVNRAISLGTAMATSGAAASPNMGYHSSPAVTFLLALFNIRLGWWLGNPGKAGESTFLGKLGRRLNLRPSYHRSIRPSLSVPWSRSFSGSPMRAGAMCICRTAGILRTLHCTKWCYAAAATSW